MNNFIAYRKPNKSYIIQFNIHEEVVKEEFLKSGGFMIAPFNDNDETLYFIGEESELAVQIQTAERSSIRRINEDSEYRDTLGKAIKSIKDNGLQKVVVSRQIQFEGKLNSMEVFLDLVSKHNNAFVYLYVINDITYIGATPELLIHKTENSINTASLAGTVSHDVLGYFSPWTEKEYHEHKLVTETIVTIYRKYCNEVNVSERKDLIASSVKHLYQNISGELKEDCNLIDILDELHPTPAIAGLPADQAIQWINKNETKNRGYYTGYFGLYSSAIAELYVNLRCLKYENEITTIYVGGGIVEGSTFESEFEETEHKAETLLSSIRKFHNIEFEYK